MDTKTKWLVIGGVVILAGVLLWSWYQKRISSKVD